MRSCDRPSNSSERVFFPSSVSKVYSFSIRTQGSSCRRLASSSSILPSSCSRSCSSLTATAHSSCVPTLCLLIVASSRSLIDRPTGGPKLIGDHRPGSDTRCPSPICHQEAVAPVDEQRQRMLEAGREGDNT